MSRKKVKPGAKILGVILLILLLTGAGYYAQQQGYLDDVFPPSANERQGLALAASEDVDPVEDKASSVIKIGVVTWGGYAGGQYFNRGFEPNAYSQFRKNYDLDVEFLVLNDFQASRSAFKSGDIDLLWATIDAIPSEIAALTQVGAKVVFQADWSRGGDAIVAAPGITSVQDLRGKTVAYAEGTPSHTFLIKTLEANDMTMSDLGGVVKVDDAIVAAQQFKSKAVDVAVVWSPDDVECVNARNNSTILTSTKTATHIIADVFLARSEWLDQPENSTNLQHLYEGWMIGAAQLNANINQARERAAEILAIGLETPTEFSTNAIDNVRFASHGDNMNFFGFNPSYKGVTGEDLYNEMTQKYRELGLVTGDVPTWKDIIYTKHIRRADKNLTGPEHAAETGPSFEKINVEQANTQTKVIATKALSIHFPTNGDQLDVNAQTIIDNQFSNTASIFGSARVRIEGNTDNTGDYQLNKNLSQRRAQAVADYLIATYDYDPNRFIIVGNGPDKPVNPNNNQNSSRERQLNRRTEIKLVTDN